MILNLRFNYFKELWSEWGYVSGTYTYDKSVHGSWYLGLLIRESSSNSYLGSRKRSTSSRGVPIDSDQQSVDLLFF